MKKVMQIWNVCKINKPVGTISLLFFHLALILQFGFLSNVAKSESWRNSLWHSSKNMEIQMFAYPGMPSIFEKRNFFDGSEVTWQDITQKIFWQYAQLKEQVDIYWGLEKQLQEVA